MDSKKKLQLSIIIGGMSLLLVLVLIAGILLMPTSTVTPPVVDGGENSEVVTPVTVQKYDITGRIFYKDGNAMADTKFCISLGPTDFTTDSNGFFILKNLPVNIYKLYVVSNTKTGYNKFVSQKTQGSVIS